MNYKIVIDPGHGGDDPGAIGNGITEKDLNLLISNYMYNRFKELNIPVKMTRQSDETLSPKDRTNRVLNSFGNSEDVIVISNHINAGGGEGAEVIYALRNNNALADSILSNLTNEGQIGRKTYQRRLPSNTSKDYYFMHRDTGKTQSVIVEYGFLDTKADAERLKNNYEKYAQAVVDAILDYTKLETKKSESKIYIVSKGDSLWSISKKFNITVDELKQANSLNSNLLSIGQKLNIPEKSNTNNISFNDEYIVKSGDTLYKIANMYNTTVDKLKSVNNLNSDLLNIGQKIIIPQSQQTYIVKSGDTLYKIANMYNTTVDKLKSKNNLNSNLLSIGQKIII